ncbi:hypothetical protein FDB37_07425 [Clostridium botulinum]|nr:hypothetical protein [Clostridium botulinum]
MYFIKSLNFFNSNDKFNICFKDKPLDKGKKIILHKGHYLLKFFLELSKSNESDRFAILLDNRIIFNNKLEIRTQYYVEISIPLEVLNEVSTLNFLNNSDDLLVANTIKGGLYMSDTTTFSIVSIDNANNKSFDLTLSEAFTNNFTVTIKSLATNQVYPCSLVSNSLFPDDPTKKTVIIGKIDYYSSTVHSATEQALINLIVPSHQTYEITIFKNDPLKTSASKSVILDSFNAIADPSTDVKVNVTGDRIVSISFKYPLRNIFDVVPIDANGEITSNNPVGHVLSNFYALYYGRDTNSSIDPTKIKWSGAFNVDRTQFSATLSADGKTLLLQDIEIGLPLTDNSDPHKLSLNKGKYHVSYDDKTKVLTDYSEEKRIIPKMEVPFITNLKSTPAIPISAFSPVRNKVIVNFDKAVMKPLDSKVATAEILFKSDGTPLKLSSITRPENNLTTLIFELDSSNPLPAGPITLGIGSISDGVGDLVDACGYIVPRTKLSFTVGSIPPTLISALQDKDIKYTDNTVVNLIFSNSMNPLSTGTGALNIGNYLFVANDGDTQEIKSLNFVGADNKTVKVTFKNLLGAGNYRLIISAGALTDTISESIAYTNVPVAIEDTTKPSVVEIIGLRRPATDVNTTITDKDNALIIKYKTPMLVSIPGLDNKYAADNPSNYKFVESTTNTNPPPAIIITPPTEGPLPTGSTGLALKDDKWIRFVLPTDLSPNYPIFENKTTLSGNPNLNYSIYIGYTELDDIKNVRNTSGNIYPLCDLKKIDATVPLIDLTKGNIEITSDSQLQYTYTDKTTISGKDYHNEFFALAPADFTIKVSNSTIPVPNAISPLNIKSLSLSEDGRTITFNFASGTFTSADKYAYIEGSEDVLDIFGKGLSNSIFNNQVINSVPSTLVGISLTNISRTPTKVTLQGADFTIGYPIEIALQFSNIISNTSPSDFLVTFNNAINAPIISASVLQKNNANTNTVLIESYIPSIATDNLDNILLVKTVSDKNLILSKDINNNPISPFGYLPVRNLAVSSIDWSFITPNLNGATLKATFNKELDFTKLPLSALKAAGTTGITINDVTFVTSDGTNNIIAPYAELKDSNNKFGTITLRKIDASKSIFTNSQESNIDTVVTAANTANTAATNIVTTDTTPTIVNDANTAKTNATALVTAANTAKGSLIPANITALSNAATQAVGSANNLVTDTNAYKTNIATALTNAQTADTSATNSNTLAQTSPYDGAAVLTSITNTQTAINTAKTSADTAANTATSAAAANALSKATIAVTAATTASSGSPTQAQIDASKAAIADLKLATAALVTAATTANTAATPAYNSAVAYRDSAIAAQTAVNNLVNSPSDSNTKFNVNIKLGSDNTMLNLAFSSATNLPLNTSNLAYVQYTGQKYEFMDSELELYVNTSLDYNANSSLK